MSDTDNTFDSSHVNRQPGTITSSLLGGIKDDREDAWSRMTLLYAPLVHFWCLQVGLQASDADDVVQEVLRTVASRVQDFEHNRRDGSFRGWLRTITRNKIGDFIRADQRRMRVSTELVSHLAESGTASPESLKEETKLVFNRVLELIRRKFEERTWRAFLRVVMDGAAPCDVADELSLSVESVYQAKSRILRRIRDELRQLGN